MDKCVLGIDLGTSSVKIVKKYRNGRIEKMKNTYREVLPFGWWNAICELLEQIHWDEVSAIGLSSQVGTYLVDEREVIGWNSSVGKKELDWWKSNYSRQTFMEEISMPHPEIISYPLPRLKYIKEHYENVKKISQPKEYIIEKLTGEWVTDLYSWRGLVNLQKGNYSKFFLRELGMEETMIPPIKAPDVVAGYTKELLLKKNVMPAGIPVYTGLNDYYAGLLGMGIGKVGQAFDVTGTSEHLGVLQSEIAENTTLVSGPYIEHMVHYGVTASSGSSIKFGLRLQPDLLFDMEKITEEKPPIFLPYVKGERAPIWNPDARGAFFGIEENTSANLMAYAVMEGVAFSLYHIYETMGKPKMNKITVSGGAATIEYLNRLKAEIFQVPIEVVKESDVSALGGCMTAAVGLGWYSDYIEAAIEWVEIFETVIPVGKYREWFEKRYEIYKEFYVSMIPLYEKWKAL